MLEYSLFFGQPFKTVRSMLSDRCPVCLSCPVCDVGALRPKRLYG